jgi:hypothetical protein
MSQTSKETTVGRNDRCPCGSGKKYKKCCGFNVAPVVPEVDPASAPPPIPGMDPSMMNPEWLQQISQAFARLPKGQQQRLQMMISKAMAGKDVSRESAELEKSLPTELQSLLNAAPIPEEATQGNDPAATPEAQAEAEKSNKFWRRIFKKK